MKKNPIDPHINREMYIEPSNNKSYMLITDTHIFVGSYSFYEYAKPGSILLSNTGDWFSAYKPKKNRLINSALKRKISWRGQTKRAVPAWIKAMSLILFN